MQKLKRRLLTLVVASSILLNGCGKENIITTKQQEEHTLPTVQLSVWGSPDEQDLLQEMIESFKVKYAEQAVFDISIDVQETADCKNRILERDVNLAADVFMFADDQLLELAAAGVLAPIKETESLRQKHIENAIEAVMLQDDLYAYPLTADNGYFMYYNKDYFTEKDVQSLDVMLDKAASLDKKVSMEMTSGWYSYSFFGNTGLEMGLNPDGITNYCNWNSKEGAIKGVDVGQAMAKIATHEGFINNNDAGLLSGAKAGKVIAGVSGVWLLNSLKEIWGDKLAAVKLPTYEVAGKQVQLASYAGYKLIGVNAYSKEGKWADTLARWLTSEENQILRAARIGSCPSDKNAASSLEATKSDVMNILLEQAPYSSLQRVGVKYWSAMSTFVQDLLDSKVTEGSMQNRMDRLVKEITANVSDR